MSEKHAHHGAEVDEHAGHHSHAPHTEHSAYEGHGAHTEHGDHETDAGHDHAGHTGHGGHGGHSGHEGHGDHVGQFRRLFWIMLVLAVPVVGFNDMFAHLLGYHPVSYTHLTLPTILLV